MLIIYDTRTYNVERFVHKLRGFRCQKIQEGLTVKEPFVLVSYTTGFGQVPETTDQFLKNNFHYLVGVAASGNRVWGSNFGKCADRIASQYHVPVIHKFELAGTNRDIEIFQQGVYQIVKQSS
ncbi:MAG: class Ib ribonucleoside-diphosphate reductase assembly flavoprotein NrdI [Bacillaceae bacterium]|nr:class Ib ribonucleoside-diphosphate reductase assembly flavoprotein NrdI [Bacillaceae bacterium]